MDSGRRRSNCATLTYPRFLHNKKNIDQKKMCTLGYATQPKMRCSYFGSDQFGSNRTEINTLPLAAIAALLLPPHRLARVPSLNLAIATATGDDTHLSRTLNAEEPHEEAQEPHCPHRHRPHSNSEPRGSQPPTCFGFSSIASWHLGLSELLSLSLFHEYRRMGFKHDYPSYSALVYKLARSRSFEAVEEILGRIEENDVPLIRHYGQVHLVDKAVGLFQRMTSFNCTCTLQSFNTILKVLVENNKLADAPNSVSFNVIMKGWLEKGEWEIACQVFDEMLEKRVQPTVVTYNSLVGFLCRKVDVERAMGLLEDMTHKGKYPNFSTYALLMEGLCFLGKFEEATKLMFDMEYRGCKPAPVNFGVLMSDLGKRGRPAEAYKLLVEMQIEGREANAATYHMMLDGFCKVEDFEGGLKVLNAMLTSEHCPMADTYCRLVEGLLRDGNIDHACFVVEEMEKRKIRVKLQSWEVLATHACGADGGAGKLLTELTL
ncbi:hypothetical protein NL676_032893 [Syzygium grande]|nr:hypothetical protein NL676_032893 [Syzygium grande]